MPPTVRRIHLLSNLIRLAAWRLPISIGTLFAAWRAMPVSARA